MFFAVFFAFFSIDNKQNIFDLGHGNKKCLLIIYRHFLFSQVKIFYSKIFQDGPRAGNHSKFKSKKQNFRDFNFLLHEA